MRGRDSLNPSRFTNKIAGVPDDIPRRFDDASRDALYRVMELPIFAILSPVTFPTMSWPGFFTLRSWRRASGFRSRGGSC